MGTHYWRLTEHEGVSLFGKLLPFLFCCVAANTVVLSMALMYGLDQFRGHIPVPFLGDVGRDPPTSGLFCAGLLMAAALLVLLAYVHHHHLQLAIRLSLSAPQHLSSQDPSSFLSPTQSPPQDHPLIRPANFVSLINRCALALALAGLAPLIASLALLDASRSPLLYRVFAILLFSTLLLYLAADVFCFDLLRRHAFPQCKRIHALIIAKLVAISWISVCFLLAFPIGLLASCSRVPLNQTECLRLQLGAPFSQNYCLQSMADVNADTLLWDYSGCPVISSMRSTMQLILTSSSLLYFISFAFDYLLFSSSQSAPSSTLESEQ